MYIHIKTTTYEESIGELENITTIYIYNLTLRKGIVELNNIISYIYINYVNVEDNIELFHL